MKEDKALIEMGQRLKNAREKANLTQFELYEMTQISTTQISSYENGRKSIGLESLAKIAIATKASMDELYFGTSPSSRATSKGELIVNCVDALFKEGVIVSLPKGVYNDFVSESEEMYYSIGFSKYIFVLDDLVKQLKRFEENKESYPNPDFFRKQIIASCINKINNDSIKLTDL